MEGFQIVFQEWDTGRLKSLENLLFLPLNAFLVVFCLRNYMKHGLYGLELQKWFFVMRHAQPVREANMETQHINRGK